MHIGNRIFPYPVLNRNEALSDYVPDSVFKLKFDVGEDGAPIVRNGKVIFKNLHCIVTDPDILQMIEKGKVKGTFIVECSASVYRKSFDISSTPYDLSISAREINGNVVASCYLYATEEIENFKSIGFLPEYCGYTFDLDRYDILAVDDGFKFKTEIDPAEDDRVASIFTIVKKEDDCDIMTYHNKERGIVIYLPTPYYASYDNIKTRRGCNNIAFAMLAIPVLVSCLYDIKKQFESMEEILDEYPWFNAVRISYKRQTGNELSYEDFDGINLLELSQLVLNSASCNGLMDFNDMLLGDIGATDEEGLDNE